MPKLYGNSVGHLALRIIGILNYYIGVQIVRCAAHFQRHIGQMIYLTNGRTK
jgi:hypothetical protein